MNRRIRATAVVGTVLALISMSPAPVSADPGPEIVVSQIKATQGQLSFILSGAGLPDQAALAAGKVTVSVEGTDLPVQIKDTKAMARADLPLRGVVLAVDTTSSMAGAPLTAVKAAVGDYLDALPAEVTVGLVAFSGTTQVAAPLTYDRAAVRTALGNLSAIPASGSTPGSGSTSAAPGTGASGSPGPGTSAGPSGTASAGPSALASGSPAASGSPGPASSGTSAPPAGGSVLYDALRQGTGLFDRAYIERRMVVITDGPDLGSKTSAAEVTTALQTDRVALDLVQYGAAAAGQPVTALATGSGGQAASAASGAALKTVLLGLIGKLPTPVAVTVAVPSTFDGRSVSLAVRVTAGGRELSATAAVTFAGAATGGADLETVRLKVLPAVVLVIAMIVIGLATAIVGFVVVNLMLGRSSARERLRQLERISGKVSQRSSEHHEEHQGSAVMRTAMALSERVVQQQGRSSIEVGLDRAGIALRPAEWTLVRAAVAGAGAFVGALILPWFLGIPAGAVGGWAFTAWYRKHRAVKRSTKFADLLPEALQLVVGALRSGFSLMQAIDAVVREGPEPVAGEFGRAVAEIRIGGEIESALERTAERNGSRDLSWLVMAIRIQREVGGNLSEVMETAVETMRERGRLVRHVRALSAEGRLSAYVLVGMPIVLSSWMMLFRGEYIKPLYTEPLGMVMIGAGVLLITVGAFWISRLVKVEV